jgi:hypothetical protein
MRVKNFSSITLAGMTIWMTPDALHVGARMLQQYFCLRQISGTSVFLLSLYRALRNEEKKIAGNHVYLFGPTWYEFMPKFWNVTKDSSLKLEMSEDNFRALFG